MNYNNKTVLVTGGTGFIATWAIIELLKRGYTVRTTVRSLNKESAVRTRIAPHIDPGERLSFFAADLTGDACPITLGGFNFFLCMDEFVKIFTCSPIMRLLLPLRSSVPDRRTDIKIARVAQSRH